jgi:hypothetical protein
MRFRRNLVLVVVAGVVGAGGGVTATVTAVGEAGASANGAGGVSSASRVGWQHAIAALPAPAGGCFRASYPLLAWHAAACRAAPTVPFGPAVDALPATASRPVVHTVGDGNDYSAVVTGLISQATGAFTDVSPSITEKGRYGGRGATFPNTYSLQLNSEFFTSPACSGSSDPAQCLGWQQFIYDSAADSVFMQYWLIDYGNNCPASWNPFEGSCYVNSGATAFVGGTLTASELATTQLAGSAHLGGTDSVELSNGSQAGIVKNADTVLTLAGSWNTTEFGVFGDGGGTEAKFGKKTTLEETTTLVSTGHSAPSCVVEGFTGETNNLKLTSTPALWTVLSPTIGSAQTDAKAQPATCATAAG